jgi:rRNA-processing protein FCF1
MMTSRSRFIIDTNILIDLHHGNALDALFQLPYLFIAPDVIIAELQEPDGRDLLRKGLKSGELSGELVLEVEQLSRYHANIAINDLFALVLAASSQLILLTGDRRLRELAAKHNVVVHGTLWILDELVKTGVLKPVEASFALRSMLQFGCRLLWQIVRSAFVFGRVNNDTSWVGRKKSIGNVP